MLDWSDVDIAVRGAVREFVDKEIRPHLDELGGGDMEPYPIIRKLFATFGIDVMAKEALEHAAVPPAVRRSIGRQAPGIGWHVRRRT